MAGVDVGRVLSSAEIATIPSSEKDAIYAALVQKLERCQSDLSACQAENARWVGSGGYGVAPYTITADYGPAPKSHDALVRERFQRREDFHRARMWFHVSVAAGVLFGTPVALVVLSLAWRAVVWAVLR